MDSVFPLRYTVYGEIENIANRSTASAMGGNFWSLWRPYLSSAYFYTVPPAEWIRCRVFAPPGGFLLPTVRALRQGIFWAIRHKQGTFWWVCNAYKSKNPTIHAVALTVYRRIFLGASDRSWTCNPLITNQLRCHCATLARSITLTRYFHCLVRVVIQHFLKTIVVQFVFEVIG